MTAPVAKSLFLLQAVLLIGAATYCYGQLNPDAIAYLRVAEHIISGEFGLALNGYWSPLFSWLLVPLLLLDADPIFAVRALMVISALAFSGGAYLLFCELRLSSKVLHASLLGTMLLSVALSYFAVAPDLLMAGGFFVLLSRLIRSDWLLNRSVAMQCGFAAGFLYLCKAAALPLTLAVLVGVLLMHFWQQNASSKQLLKSALFFVAGTSCVAGPWILILSVHYGYPTISTVASIAHAIEGPWDYSPHGEVIPGFSGILIPEAGRLTTWEEPSLQDFPYWSPFHSSALFKHQISSIAVNVRLNFVYLLFLICALCVHLRIYRRTGKVDSTAWTSIVVVGANVLVFLPTHSASIRYFLPAIPLLLAAVLKALFYVTRQSAPTFKISTMYAAAILSTVLLLKPIYGMTLRPFNGGVDYYPIGLRARGLAEELRAKGLVGPIVGGNPLGLYLSYFLRQPWYGGAEGSSIGDVEAVNALIVIVNETTWNNRLRRSLNRSDFFSKFETSQTNHMDDIGLPEAAIYIAKNADRVLMESRR
ncbi:MAG: hypothetical protein KDD66_04050 [Bdellovibrionales bacterium]|nr:hypothetical protein [Bdellovibrionales bacterium]